MAEEEAVACFLSVWGWSEQASSVCQVGENRLPQYVGLVRACFLSVSGWSEKASSVCGVGQNKLPQCVGLVGTDFLSVLGWSEQASSPSLLSLLSLVRQFFSSGLECLLGSEMAVFHHSLFL